MVNKAYLLKVFGFNLPHWTNATLWSMGILAMLALTARDLRPILIDYLSDDDNTQVKIKVKRGDEIESDQKRPDLYFCLPLPRFDQITEDFVENLWNNLTQGAPCPFCEVMSNHSWDVWNRYWNLSEIVWKYAQENATLSSNSMLYDFGEDLKSIFVKKLLENRTFDSDLLDESNLDWSRPILGALVSELSSAIEPESQFLMYNNDQISDNMAGPESRGKARLNRLYSFVVLTACKFLTLWHDLDQMPDEMCQKIMFDSSSFVPFTFDYRDHPRLCFRLPFDRDLRLSVGELYFKYVITKPLFKIYSENAGHVPDGDGFTALFTSTATAKDQMIRREYLTIVYSTRRVSENRGHKLATCYRESSKSECVWNRKTEHLESICQCELFAKHRSLELSQNRSLDLIDNQTAITSNQSIRYCDQDQLRNCFRAINRRKSADLGCSEPCESNSYQFQTKLITEDGWSEEFEVIVERRQTQPYLVFTVGCRSFCSWLMSSKV